MYDGVNVTDFLVPTVSSATKMRCACWHQYVHQVLCGKSFPHLFYALWKCIKVKEGLLWKPLIKEKTVKKV